MWEDDDDAYEVARLQRQRLRRRRMAWLMAGLLLIPTAVTIARLLS